MTRHSHPPVRTFGKRGLAVAEAVAPSQSFDERWEKILEDVKLFATGWVAGLVFFGTLLA